MRALNPPPPHPPTPTLTPTPAHTHTHTLSLSLSHLLPSYTNCEDPRNETEEPETPSMPRPKFTKSQKPDKLTCTYSLHCSFCLGLPFRILDPKLVKPKKGTTMETIGAMCHTKTYYFVSDYTKLNISRNILQPCSLKLREFNEPKL